MPFPTWSLRDEIDPLPLTIGAVLMLTLVVQLARPAATPPDRGVGPQARPELSPASTATPDYARILSRPLFTPGRGAAGAAGVDQAASTSLSDYTLVGLASVGGRGEAVFRGPAGDVVSLRAGEALLGWQVAAIERDGIVLQQGDVRRKVQVASPAAPKLGAQ